MPSEIETASRRLFGPGSLGLKNIKFVLGSGPDITAENIAREINRSLDRLEAGDFEVVGEELESDEN